MGLFSNDKKPCPVCGKGTPKLLATKIADETPICSACAEKVSIEESQLEVLSAEGLKEHLAMREENAKYIKNVFRPTKEIKVDGDSLNIDEINRAFTIPVHTWDDNPPVFQFDELIGYELLAKPRVVERFHKGDASPEYIPIVFGEFSVLFRDDVIALSSPCSFLLILYLTNPCWSKLEVKAGAVYPKHGGMKSKVYGQLDELQTVTAALLDIMGYSAGDGASTNSAARERIKFQELLDGGIITQEEFDEKERELSEAYEEV